MKTITYKFSDGTIRAVEAADEICALHEQSVRQEKRNHWRETRRHTSLDSIDAEGKDFASVNSNPLDALIRQEENAVFVNALELLTPEQRELAEKVFIDGMTMTAVAKAAGVSQQSVSKRVARIIAKLRNFFETGL